MSEQINKDCSIVSLRQEFLKICYATLLTFDQIADVKLPIRSQPKE